MSLEARVSALEKRVLQLEKTIDSFKRLKHTGNAMTVHEAGRRGGQAKVVKGPAKLPPERRQEIAKKAAAARWGKGKGDEKGTEGNA